MESLYSALEGEISAFVGHVQQCRQGFDLRSLYQVLLLVLPQSPSGQVESWQHLQKLAQHWPGSASPDVASYVGWMASYLQHLSVLKERFDSRVVVPLCEYLYMHEELAAHPTWQSSPASIPHLAAQLFAHRRNWGLLLQGGSLSERVFSPQSLRDLHGFAGVEPFVKVLRLVPDVFHQSLAMAELAQRWVHLHRSRYSLSLPPSPSPSPSPSPPQQPPAWGRAGLAPSTVQPPPHSRTPQQPGSPLDLPDLLVPPRSLGAGSSPRVLRARLQESQEELLALLQRGERAAALRAQVHHVARRIQVLRLQQQGEGTELAQPRQSPRRGSCRHRAALAEELQKNLELEEYHHSILEADWLLELEVRPILIRRIDAVQQRCQDLERMLRGQALPAPLRAQLRSRTATTPAPRQAQPSAGPTAVTSQPQEQPVTLTTGGRTTA
ncbi:myosin-10 isoform x2 [Limosa lapponica baueri]|uniref:Myosin-10 isoform x2 n=1 Tax=Limosa lapponica baueri TaxID=1758121 RepID=A0A2I0UQS0_LIMLA|nr:myosin-10 isoform x2 [Limosa lapponica baueri]